MFQRIRNNFLCYKQPQSLMKKFQILFAAFILSIALLATSSIQPAFAEGKLITDTITSPSLKGNLIGDPATRNMIIYLPPGYDTSGERYPVVYLMPGPGFTERYWPYNEGPGIAASVACSANRLSERRLCRYDRRPYSYW